MPLSFTNEAEFTGKNNGIVGGQPVLIKWSGNVAPITLLLERLDHTTVQEIARDLNDISILWNVPCGLPDMQYYVGIHDGISDVRSGGFAIRDCVQSTMSTLSSSTTPSISVASVTTTIDSSLSSTSLTITHVHMTPTPSMNDIPGSSGTTTATSSSPPLSTAAKVGIAVGGAAGLFLILGVAALILLFLRRKRKTKPSDDSKADYTSVSVPEVEGLAIDKTKFHTVDIPPVELQGSIGTEEHLSTYRAEMPTPTPSIGER